MNFLNSCHIFRQCLQAHGSVLKLSILTHLSLLFNTAPPIRGRRGEKKSSFSWLSWRRTVGRFGFFFSFCSKFYMSINTHRRTGQFKIASARRSLGCLNTLALYLSEKFLSLSSTSKSGQSEHTERTD